MILFLKNLVFTILVPGTVGLVLPVFVLRHPPARLHVGSIPGALLILAGSTIYSWCLWDFARVGRGTPAPIDPPRNLVTRGLYNHVRNPMYVGVLAVIAGWALVFRSSAIAIYGAAVLVSVHLFVRLYEEPHLRKIFGHSYVTYCQRVHRWLPRIKARAVMVLLAGLATVPVLGEEGPLRPLPAQLVAAAIERTTRQVRYDGSYRVIPYPGGDVPDHIGVCTDLIIRSYRAVGIDLQQRVHEDMSEAFPTYPDLWGLDAPDPSIDHRRVPNLRTFFERHGLVLRPSQAPEEYLPGDIVTWRLPGGRPHIGLVTDRPSGAEGRPLVVHNIGSGPVLEDMLFRYDITGHYRYPPADSP